MHYQRLLVYKIKILAEDESCHDASLYGIQVLHQTPEWSETGKDVGL